LIEIGSKTAEKNSAQTNRHTNRQTLRKWWSLGREPIYPQPTQLTYCSCFSTQ